MRLVGLNVARGFGITLKHFLNSYVVDAKRLMGLAPMPGRFNGEDSGGTSTVSYPEVKLPMPERFRVLPFLIYDGEKPTEEGIRCTSCGICAKVCPPQCIWIVQGKEENGKIKPKPADFFIDTDVCMNCGLCAEYCPFDAIKMDHDYENAGYERWNEHVFNLEKLLKPAEYLSAIRPTLTQEEDDGRAAEAAAKAAKKVAPAAGATPA